MIEKLKNKIYLLIGRAIISAIDNSKKTAAIQVTGLKGETITDVEFIAPYGLEAMPTEGQAVVLFVNGNRDQGLAVALHNKDERPTDLEDDEVKLYSKFDNYVLCNKDGEIEINGKDDYAVAYDDLKKVLDELQEQITDLRTAITKWIPVAQDGGAALKFELAAWLLDPIIEQVSTIKVDKVKLP